jgi:hypothetical protein
LAVGSTGHRPVHRSLEGVRPLPRFNSPLGGFTKFGCSTSVDTDRRLFTGFMPGTFGRSGQLAAEIRNEIATAVNRVIDPVRPPGLWCHVGFAKQGVTMQNVHEVVTRVVLTHLSRDVQTQSIDETDSQRAAGHRLELYSSRSVGCETGYQYQ